MAARPHTEACRKRMYEEMGKTEKGKEWLKKADEKINEYCGEQEKKRQEEEQRGAQSQGGIVGPASDGTGTRGSHPSGASVESPPTLRRQRHRPYAKPRQASLAWREAQG